jgi:hypothetical protein
MAAGFGVAGSGRGAADLMGDEGDAGLRELGVGRGTEEEIGSG